MRENHYAIHCAKDANFLGFHHHKISITLLIISNMSGDGFHQVRYKILKSATIIQYTIKGRFMSR